MEHCVVKLLNFIVHSIITYLVIWPIIYNKLKDNIHNHSYIFYKTISALLLFTVILNLGDFIYDFGNYYFNTFLVVGWSLVILGFVYRLKYNYHVIE